MNPRTHDRASLSVLVTLVLTAFAPAQVGDKGAKKVQAKPAAAGESGETSTDAAKTGAAAGKRTETLEKLPIAVVDMEKVAPHSKAYKSGRETLKRLGRVFNGKLKQIEGQIESLKLELQLLLQPSPEKIEKTLQLRSLIGRHGLADKLYSSEYGRQQAMNDNAIYKEVQAAVRELAQKRGIVLVLRKHTSISVAAMLDKKQALSEVAAIRKQTDRNRNRSVLYSAEGTDITEDVIKILKGK